MYKVCFKQKVVIFNLRSGTEAVLRRTEEISAACGVCHVTNKGVSSIYLSQAVDNPYTNKSADEGKQQVSEAVSWLSKARDRKPMNTTTETQLFCIDP